MKQILLTICLILFVLPTWSDNSFSRDEANKCSSLFMILTSIQNEEPALGEYYTNLGQLASILTGLYWGEETSQTITNGMISDIKSEEMEIYGQRYPLEKQTILSELENCMGWTFQIGQIIQSNPSAASDNNLMKELLLSSPKPNQPFDYPFEDKSWLNEFLDEAFLSWIEMGKVTPNSMKELLNVN